MRKHVCKLAYADEWAGSIQDSHPDSSARRATLDAHWKDVGIIRNALDGVAPSLGTLLATDSGSAAAAATTAQVEWFP